MSVRRLILTLVAALTGAVGALTFGAASALAIAANGSYIQADNAIYEVIGGAAIHVDSCSTLNGCPKVTKVTSLAGYASVPANGSFIQIQDDGGFIGEIAGGALIHVDSCTNIKCTGTLPLDPGGAAAYVAAHPTPLDGTFIESNGGPGYPNSINEVIGAAILHVDSCTSLCTQAVDLDAGGVHDYSAAHPLPANGTFVQVANGPQTGLIARVAGGAFLTIGDCAAIGGCPSTIDQLDSGGFNDWSAAHAVPSDGTYLLGLPSNTTWEVSGGQRQQSSISSAAVPVDDSSLNVIPLPPVVAPAPTATSSTTSTTPISTAPPAQTTVTPPKSASKLRRVKLVVSFDWLWNGARSQLVFVRTALARPLRLTIRCTGKGCPYRILTWRRGTAKTFLRHLHGGIYRAGDKLTLTFSRQGYISEAMSLTIRYGRAPLHQLLKR